MWGAFRWKLPGLPEVAWLWESLGYFSNNFSSLGNAAINSFRSRAGVLVTGLLWGMKILLMVLVKGMRLDRDNARCQRNAEVQGQSPQSPIWASAPAPPHQRWLPPVAIMRVTFPKHVQLWIWKPSLTASTWANSNSTLRHKAPLCKWKGFDWKNVTLETRSGIELKLPEKWKHWHN